MLYTQYQYVYKKTHIHSPALLDRTILGMHEVNTLAPMAAITNNKQKAIAKPMVLCSFFCSLAAIKQMDPVKCVIYLNDIFGWYNSNVLQHVTKRKGSDTNYSCNQNDWLSNWNFERLKVFSETFVITKQALEHFFCIL